MADIPAHAHLNLRVRGMPSSATVASNERSNALLQAGRRVFKLGLGQSPFPVPEPVVQALRDSAHEKDYLPVRGLPALRQAVAAHHDRAAHTGSQAEDVLVGPGSKELIFLLQLAFQGDLLIPSPAWVSYAPQARMLGRRVQQVPTRQEDGWRVRPEALDAICREDPTRPRVLILNYPSNPTGFSFEDEGLRALAEVARRYRLVLLSDEIYGELHHQGRHVSIARHYPEGTIISSGLSKWCGAGGWRLGTFVFPRAMRWLLDAVAAAASETYTSASAPIQHAAVRAFQGGPEIERYLADSRRILAALGCWFAARLRAANVSCADPEGAFYLFPDLAAHRERLAARAVHGSAQLCERLLEDTGVVMLPGTEFGRPADELTCRLAYVDFDGAQALAEIARLAPDARLDEAFLRRCCPRVCEAADRVADWLAAR